MCDDTDSKKVIVFYDLFHCFSMHNKTIELGSPQKSMALDHIWLECSIFHPGVSFFTGEFDSSPPSCI